MRGCLYTNLVLETCFETNTEPRHVIFSKDLFDSIMRHRLGRALFGLRKKFLIVAALVQLEVIMPSALWRGGIPIAVGNVFTEKVVTSELLEIGRASCRERV